MIPSLSSRSMTAHAVSTSSAIFCQSREQAAGVLRVALNLRPIAGFKGETSDDGDPDNAPRPVALTLTDDARLLPMSISVRVFYLPLVVQLDRVCADAESLPRMNPRVSKSASQRPMRPSLKLKADGLVVGNGERSAVAALGVASLICQQARPATRPRDGRYRCRS